MINIPSEIKQLIYSESVSKNYRISFPNGERADICNEELEKESVEIKDILCSEKILKFGSCNSAQLKFTTFDISDLAGCDIVVTLEIYCDATVTGGVFREDLNHIVYPIPMGHFRIKSCVIDDKSRSKVTAYDAIYRFSEKNVSDWYNSLSFPMSLGAFRTSLAKYLGIEQREDVLVNDELIVLRTISDTELTASTVISKIAEINGVMAHIDRNGKLAYIPLEFQKGALRPSNGLHPAKGLHPSKNGGGKSQKLTSGAYIELECDDFISNAPDKLQIATVNGDVGAVVGNGTNMYKILDNFLTYGKGTDELKAIASNVLNRISKATYRPIEASCIGDPALELGDYVTFILENGNKVDTFILERTLKGIQSLTDEYVTQGSKSYNYDRRSSSNEILKLRQKTNVITETVEQYHREMTDIEYDFNGKYEYTMSYINQTAESLETKIENGTIEWDLAGLKIKTIAAGEPQAISTAKWDVGDMYLNQLTGIVYKVDSVQESGGQNNYTWSIYKQLEKKETAYWSAIQQTSEAITTEVSEREQGYEALSARIQQTADSITSEVSKQLNAEISNKDGTLGKTLSDMSTKITQNADGITSEASARETADNNIVSDYNSKISQASDKIEAKVSSSGGDSKDFAWSLDANGFYLWSNGEKVATFDKNSAVFKGMIQAGSGYIGSEEQGFTLGEDGTLSSKDEVGFRVSNISDPESTFMVIMPKVTISPESIELVNQNRAYTYIGAGCVYSCLIDYAHEPTDTAPWRFMGDKEFILKDGDIYFPNRTKTKDKNGNIYVQMKASNGVAGKYRAGSWMKDDDNHIYNNGVKVAGGTKYDDPFYDGELNPL